MITVSLYLLHQNIVKALFIHMETTKTEKIQLSRKICGKIFYALRFAAAIYTTSIPACGERERKRNRRTDNKYRKDKNKPQLCAGIFKQQQWHLTLSLVNVWWIVPSLQCFRHIFFTHSGIVSFRKRKNQYQYNNGEILLSMGVLVIYF